jgi:hypothetical protein
MERKALVIFILLLSSLVVLALLHYNQQALAPMPSPTTIPTAAVTAKPYSALIDLTGNATQNATITPSPVPTEVLYTQSTAQHSTPTPPPNQMTPTAMQPLEPTEAWEPMKAMTPAIPMGAMTPWQPLF